MNEIENPEREHKDLQSEGWRTGGAKGAVAYKEGCYDEKGEQRFSVHIYLLVRDNKEGVFEIHKQKWAQFREESAGQMTTWDKHVDHSAQATAFDIALAEARRFIKEGQLTLVDED